MSFLGRVIITPLLIALAGHQVVRARTRAGDSLIAQARQSEARATTEGWERAINLARRAVDSDRDDIYYQLEATKICVLAAQFYTQLGHNLQRQGKTDDAVKAYSRASEIDPTSSIAAQELARIQKQMGLPMSKPTLSIANVDALGQEVADAERLFSQSTPLPDLEIKLAKPLPILKVNNQPASQVFLTLCGQVGIQIFFDPDYQNRFLGLNQQLDYSHSTLTQALDNLALITRSFWKPLSARSIFVSNDDQSRRSAFEDQITKAFYLKNVPSAQEVGDIAATVQKITDIRKLFVHPAQGVIVVRSDPDRVALAEKIIEDLDKSRPEIVIDILIFSVTRDWVRQLGVAMGLNGSNSNILFAPGSQLGAAAGSTRIPLDQVKNLAAGDFNVTLPGAAVLATLDNVGAKLLDKAQLRTVEGQKSEVRIGERVPLATGSFLPGAAAVSTSLINTQFSYEDVGLNIDVIAKVHEPDEVSLHIEADHSSVESNISIGGISQPIFSQRRRVADLRVKEGEANLWDLITERADLRTSTGLPFLSQIPFIGRAFGSERVEKSETQVLTLLVPHIIRQPDIRTVNVRGLLSGSDQVVRLRFDGSAESKPAGEGVIIEVPPAPPSVIASVSGGAGAPGGGAMGMPPASGISLGIISGFNSPLTSSGMGSAFPLGVSNLVGTIGALRLSFNPAQVSLVAGATGAIDVVAAPGAQFVKGQIVIQYDPRIVSLTAANRGPSLSDFQVSPLPGVLAPDGIYTLAFSMLPGSPAGTGPLVLATLNFKALMTGQASVSVSRSRFTNAAGTEEMGLAETATIVVR